MRAWTISLDRQTSLRNLYRPSRISCFFLPSFLFFPTLNISLLSFFWLSFYLSSLVSFLFLCLCLCIFSDVVSPGSGPGTPLSWSVSFALFYVAWGKTLILSTVLECQKHHCAHSEAQQDGHNIPAEALWAGGCVVSAGHAGQRGWQKALAIVCSMRVTMHVQSHHRMNIIPSCLQNPSCKMFLRKLPTCTDIQAAEFDAALDTLVPPEAPPACFYPSSPLPLSFFFCFTLSRDRRPWPLCSGHQPVRHYRTCWDCGGGQPHVLRALRSTWDGCAHGER